jgi:alcohol dehydrogenase, propanol-preferring
VLRTPGPIEAGARLSLEELALPEPGPGQVRMRVEACGVCHTDLHVVEGELPPLGRPVVPGHQVVGMIEAVGEGVDPGLVGRRVGVGWLGWTDGTCRHCRAGHENLCEQARFTGYQLNGGYAEACVAAAAFVYRLPETIRPDEPARLAPLLCAGVVGYRALRLSGVGASSGGAFGGGAPGGGAPGAGPASPAASGAGAPAAGPGGSGPDARIRLGLYGFGASAHLVLQIAVRHFGCQVLVFTRGAEHRRLALDLGAAWAGPAEEISSPGGPLDAAIIFAPAGGLVPLALRALDRGGRLVLAGIYMSPIPELPYALLWQERSVRSVANATRRDAQDLLALAGQLELQVEVESLPLAEANAALARLKAGQVRGALVLVP